LLLWGVEHDPTPPSAEEPVGATHVLNGTRVTLNALARRPTNRLRWTWRFPGEPYTLAFDGSRWELSPGLDPDAEVVVDTTPRAWAELVTAPPAERRTNGAFRLSGSAANIRIFTKAFDLTVAP
jgi:hypothetical protein